MCATGSGKPVEKNKAAGLAVQLVKQRAKLCVTEDQAVLKSESAKSLVKNSVKSSPSVVSFLSKSAEPGPSKSAAVSNTNSGNHVSEDMDITDSSSGNKIEPVSSTDSLENSSPLILVHSRASNSSRATIPAPRITHPAPPTPDPSMTTTSSYTSSGSSGSTSSSSVDLGITTSSSSSGGLAAILEADLLAVEADLMDMSSPPPPPMVREGKGGVAVSSSSVKLELAKEAGKKTKTDTCL